MLYDHFPSKHALFVEVLDVEQEALLAYLRAALGSQGTTEERWRATFDAFFTFVEEHPSGWRLLFPSHPPLNPEAHRNTGGIRAASNAVLASLLAADAHRAGLEPETVRARALFAIHRDGLTAAARWWEGHPDVTRPRSSTPRWPRCGPDSADYNRDPRATVRCLSRWLQAALELFATGRA